MFSFHINSLELSVFFTSLAISQSVNINFLLDILDVYLEFIKFIVGRTDSYTQALLDIGNSFSVTESVPKTSFSFNIHIYIDIIVIFYPKN